MSKSQSIFVTKPFMPPLEEMEVYLKEIWESNWLTNNGPFHQRLEKDLAAYLGVKHLSLFSNGTAALQVAFQALDLQGEVITTPYSFVATTNALIWNRLAPKFVDIDPENYNIDVKLIEDAINEDTAAILPVHVYGNPCETDKIDKLAKKYNLKVIYDAAHAFGVKKNNQTILNAGDLSVLSFHATKVFNTFEGGAIISPSAEMKKRIDQLKNFGIVDETTVIAPGINAKMNEFQAAFGLLQLKYIDELINKRREKAGIYSRLLGKIPGINTPKFESTTNYNYSYYPIRIQKNTFHYTRDQIYERLKENGIFSRKYFFPLISNMPMYAGLKSASKANLPKANLVADEILCLPVYHDLKEEIIGKIVSLIIETHE